MKLLIWALFLCVCAYSILDYYQTVALLESGATELNPLVKLVIDINGDLKNILYFKVTGLTFAAVVLFIYLKGK